MAQPSRPRSPLSMVVLSLVCEEPMHPYRMQTLIKERGKDQIANVAQRNSVYQTIAALRRAGLLTIRETSREERRPERTVYEATKEGRRTLTSWMRTVLSTPARDFPDFPAALPLLRATRARVRSATHAATEGPSPRLLAVAGDTPVGSDDRVTIDRPSGGVARYTRRFMTKGRLLQVVAVIAALTAAGCGKQPS